MNLKGWMVGVGLLFLAGGAGWAGESAASPPAKRLEARPAKAPTPRFSEPKPAVGPGDLVVDVSAKYQDMDCRARFVVGSGEQANHVAGGEKPFAVRNAQGTGVEFKKWGCIVNILPVLDEQGRVRAQLQIEVSGPIKGIESQGADVPGIATWQYQSAFTAQKGRRKLLVETPATVTVVIDEYKGD